jgi:hypothetical protein
MKIETIAVEISFLADNDQRLYLLKLSLLQYLGKRKKNMYLHSFKRVWSVANFDDLVAPPIDGGGFRATPDP